MLLSYCVPFGKSALLRLGIADPFALALGTLKNPRPFGPGASPWVSNGSGFLIHRFFSP